MLTAKNGFLDVAKCFITTNDEVNWQIELCFTPLMMATKNSHLDITKCLIGTKADLNLQGKLGTTPLIL